MKISIVVKAFWQRLILSDHNPHPVAVVRVSHGLSSIFLYRTAGYGINKLSVDVAKKKNVATR